MKQSKALLLFLILIIKNIKAEDIRLDTVEIKIKKQHEFVEQQSAIPLKIIDHKTIKTLKATQLLDVLSKEDSVHLVKNGNKLSPSLYGFSPEHTLMLVDGKRMAMEPMNIFELERIQLSNIDRIEIISGPLSSIYGADALGGVINIITKKKADKKPFKLTLKNSTYDFKSGKNSLMLGFNKKINNHTFFYDGSFSRDDELLLNANQSIDGYKNIINNKIKYHFADDFLELDVNASRVHDKHRNKYYNFLNSSYVFDVDSNQRKQIDFKATLFNHNFTHTFLANTSTYNKNGDTFLSKNNQLLMNKRAQINLYEIQNSNEMVTDNNVIGFGVHYKGEKFNGNAFNYNNHSIYYPKNKSVYITDQYSFNNIYQFNVSVRHDWQKYFEDKLTKQIGLAVLPDNEDSFGYKLNFSEGYRSPTTRDLYVDVMVMKGNPLLSLESTKNVSFEVNRKTQDAYFKLNTFYSNVSDFIQEYYDNSINKFTYRNISGVDIYGTDLFSSLSVNSFDFNFNYMYLNAIDSNRKKLAGRTEHTLKLKVSKNINDRLQVGPEFACKKNDYIYDINNNLVNMDYCSVSTAISYLYNNEFDFSFRVNNIFDYYRFGISERPRLISLGVNLNY